MCECQDPTTGNCKDSRCLDHTYDPTDLDCRTVTITNYVDDDESGFPVSLVDGATFVRGSTSTTGGVDVIYPRPVLLVHGTHPQGSGDAGTPDGTWRRAFCEFTHKDDTATADCPPVLGGRNGKKEFVVFLARNLDGSRNSIDNAMLLDVYLQYLFATALPKLTDGNVVAIDVVAHSLGGTVVRQYFAFHRPGAIGVKRQRIASLVMMGTPSAGTQAAEDLCGFLGSNAAVCDQRFDPRASFNRNNPDADSTSPHGNIMGSVKYYYVAGISDNPPLFGWLSRASPPKPADGVTPMQSVFPWSVCGFGSCLQEADNTQNEVFRTQTTTIVDDHRSKRGEHQFLCTGDDHSGLHDNAKTLGEVESRLLNDPSLGNDGCDAYYLASPTAASGGHNSATTGLAVALDTIVDGGGPSSDETWSFTVDDLASLSLTAQWAFGEADVVLTDPADRRIDANTGAMDPSVSYVSKPGSPNVISYSIQAPLAGTWGLRITLAPNYSDGGLPMFVTIQGQSDLVLESRPRSAEYPVGQSAVIEASLTDTLGPVAGAVCGASPLSGFGPRPTYPMLDDGVRPDAAPGDGRYTAQIPASRQAGVQSFEVRCSGFGPGHGEFVRRAVVGYDAVEASATFAVTQPTEALVDLDGNGLADALETSFEVNLLQTGLFTLRGTLRSLSGVLIATVTTNVQAAGPETRVISVDFGGREIRGSGFDGPYNVTGLSLFDSVTGEIPVDQRLDWTTGSHAASEFDIADADGDGVPDTSDICPGSFDPLQVDADVDGRGDICDDCLLTYNPGQEDQDRDRIGDACDNCPSAANTDQSDVNRNGIGDVCDPDADSDGTPSALDCAPYSAGTSDLPREVGSLTVQSSGTGLTWSYPSGVNPGELFRYAVVRGDISDLQEDGGFPRAICKGSVTSGSLLGDPETPAVGKAFYYLVAAANVCGGGTFGTGSDGQKRVVTACP